MRAYRNIVKLFAISCCTSLASVSSAQDVMVSAYTTWNTSQAPEVNVMVTNAGSTSRQLLISFLYPGTVTEESCERRLSGGNSDSVGGTSYYYNSFDYSQSTAILPVGKFVHRFHSFYGRLNPPCSIQITIHDADTGRIVHDEEFRVSGWLPTANDFKARDADVLIGSMVESNARLGNLLITTRIRNSSAYGIALGVTRKRLMNCGNIGFDYEHPVRQGLDGTYMSLAPGSYGVALTPIAKNSSEKVPVSCRLEMEISQIGGTLRKRVSVPLISIGVYEAFGLLH